MSGSVEPTPVEVHLGDRLAALIDGELEHEARERVLAHLATCPGCKAEADAQRRVKSVCAGSAPPPPSDGLLARLQGLPMSGSGVPADFTGPDGPGGPDTPIRVDMQYPYPEGPGSHQGGFGAGFGGFSGFGAPKGFRTHRSAEAERVARGRRFAFATAGAVSLAAVALGGLLSTGQPSAGSSTTASPARVPAAGPAARPTTHSSPPAALGKGTGGAVSAEAQKIPLSDGRGGAAPYLPWFGRGDAPLLSPPLVLAAAHRQGMFDGAGVSAPPLGLQPYAMPSANGSPAGPLPPTDDQPTGPSAHSMLSNQVPEVR